MLCCCLQKHMYNSIVDFYKNNSKNKHTTKATNSWLRTYTLWAEGNNQIVKIHAIENAVELNKMLELFFSNVKIINNYSTKVSYYMLGSSSSNSNRDKYINTRIRVQYRFIFLLFLFSELFGTRAYALVQLTQKIKKNRKKIILYCTRIHALMST